MRQQNNLATLLRDFFDRGQNAFNARGIGNFALLHGHIQIHAQ
jgi:hypothetical protein